MSFDNKQKITEIDLGWQKSDYVSPLVCTENDDKDADASGLNFAWFKVDSKLAPSEHEEEERKQAMMVQLKNKIINKYGLPYGSPMPKEVKEILKEREEKKGSKWDRKRKRVIDRQIEKDMAAARERQRLAASQHDLFSSTSTYTNNNNTLIDKHNSQQNILHNTKV